MNGIEVIMKGTLRYKNGVSHTGTPGLSQTATLGVTHTAKVVQGAC